MGRDMLRAQENAGVPNEKAWENTVKTHQDNHDRNPDGTPTPGNTGEINAEAFGLVMSMMMPGLSFPLPQ